MKEVLGEVSLPGLQGAAQLLATMAEGAGEVEVFIATGEGSRSGLSSKPHPGPPPTPNAISLRKTPRGLWGLCGGVRGRDSQVGFAEVRVETQLHLGPSAQLQAPCWAMAVPCSPSFQAAPAGQGPGASVHMRR